MATISLSSHFTRLAILLTFIRLVPLFAHASPVNANANATASELHERTPSASNKVIIQLFEWTWDSVAAECKNFIGPAGYGYVQGPSTMKLVAHRRVSYYLNLLTSVNVVQ